MFERFFPDDYVESTYVIDFERLYREGIRGVIFDIDNTLVPHGAPADLRAVKFFEKLRSLGMDYCLISNNQLPRVQPFADAVQAKFVEDAHKPARKSYLRAMELMHVDQRSCLFVGDQIFTDVYGARRCGIRSILVKPIHPKEEIQIVLKRYLERIVLYFYKKSRSEGKGYQKDSNTEEKRK